MKISTEFPPNIEKIRAKFKLHDRVVFTYGNTIYNPTGLILPQDLIIHESTHVRQQGKNPEGWWDNYLEDSEFRMRQELEAYRAQWKYILRSGYKFKFQLLDVLAKDFASEMYGEILTKEEAKKKIMYSK